MKKFIFTILFLLSISNVFANRIDIGGSGNNAPTDADYLVGTANGSLSAEIVVGTTPGGELGNTWASPTVDSTHSGSAHHSAVTVTDSTTVNLTLTGQDITADSLLTAGDHLTLTAADLDVDDDFVLNTSDAMSGTLTVAGNIGIGSTSPLYKLDVNGTVGIGSTAYFASNVGIGSTDPTQRLDLGNGNLITTGSIGGVNVTSGANPGHTHTGSSLSGIDISEDTNLAGDTEIVLTGDALSIASTITRDTELSAYQTVLTNSAGLAGALSDEVGTGYAVFNASPNFTGSIGIGTTQPLGALHVGVGTTAPNALIISSSTGKVGIGSTIPTQELDVNGTVKATTFSGDLTGNVTGNVSGNAGTVTNGVYTTNNLSALAATTSAQLYGVISDETGSASGTPLLVFNQAPTIANPVITNIAPAANFTLTQNSVVPFTSVNTGAVVNTLYLNAGNVGIGTTNPLASLDIVGIGTTAPNFIVRQGYVGIGTTNPTVALEVTASSIKVGSNTVDLSDVTDEYVLAFDTGTQTWRGVAASAGSGDITSVGDVADGAAFDGTQGTTLTFNNAGGDATQIYDGTYFAFSKPGTFVGNVGIGTTIPRQALDVVNNGIFTGNVGIGTTAPRQELDVVNDIIASGNIGIGTTVPRQKLDTVGIGIFSTNVGIATTAPRQSLDVVGNGIISGYVGIGTTNPYYEHLLVVANDYTGNDYGQIAVVGATTPTVTMTMGYNTTGDYGFLTAVNRGVGYKNIVMAPSGGNVGIGTTGPGQQLHTTGTVRFANFGAGTATFDANGIISSVSDERLKNIQSLFTPSLNEVLQIQPILYRYKEESGLDTENIYAGFSAQNVMKYIPEAVGKDKQGNYTFNDRPVMAAMLNAIKELHNEIQVLRKQLNLSAKSYEAIPLENEERIIKSK